MNRIRDISKDLGYCPKVMNFRDYYDAYLATGNTCMVRNWYHAVAGYPNFSPVMMRRLEQMTARRNRALGFKKDYLS